MIDTTAGTTDVKSNDVFKNDNTLPSNRGLHPRLLTAGSIVGDRVRNEKGETLGKIDELMVDLENGKIHYVVLASGGFLGIGDKLFAIPLNAMRVDGPNKEFVLNVDKEMLERAPGFDKNNWPDFTSREYEAQIYNYYGSVPYWEDSLQH
jgi:sporulation protein YlmC with PRC-barrel domain